MPCLLVIEDERKVLRALQRGLGLENEGYQVIAIGDHGHPVLVVFDVEMTAGVGAVAKETRSALDPGAHRLGGPRRPR